VDVKCAAIPGKSKQKQLPFVAKSFGRWWDKDKASHPQNIDVLVDSLDGKKLILGECKWKDNIRQTQALRLLADRARLFSDYETQQWLFVKDIDVREQTDKIVTVDDMYVD